MKKLRALIPIIISLIIVLNLSSCFLIVTKDRPITTNPGKHKGWYKTPNKSTKVVITPNYGNGHGNGHGKGKHK